jgi:phage shock protein PspC (stress-responsive transcriptional regulator)
MTKVFIMPLKQTLNHLGRSRQNKILGGVCAGIAETTDTPPWLWRAIFVLIVLLFGTGILVYIVLWLLMPYRDEIT